MKNPSQSVPAPQNDLELFCQHLERIPSPELKKFVWLSLAGRAAQLDLDSDWQRAIEAHTNGVPKWAIKAAAKVSECLFRPPKSKEAQSENFKLGNHFGILKQLTDSTLQGSSAKDFGIKSNLVSSAQNRCDKMFQTVFSETGRTPNAAQAEIHKGFARGLERERADSEAYLYFLLATKWREVSKMKNAAQLQSWLTDKIGANATGTRERVTLLCRRLGLRFADKGGRPANRKT